MKKIAFIVFAVFVSGCASLQPTPSAEVRDQFIQKCKDTSEDTHCNLYVDRVMDLMKDDINRSGIDRRVREACAERYSEKADFAQCYQNNIDKFWLNLADRRDLFNRSR